MRSLIAALLFASFQAVAQTQVPNVFVDGTKASAAEVNENFQYVLENASGGCSATQQDKSVLIECADGTSGVLAAGGTVLIFPEAILGEPPDPIDIPSGDFAVLDAEGQLLGGYAGVSSGYTTVILENLSVGMRNDEQSQSIQLRDAPVMFYYSEEDCQGAEFIDGTLSQVLRVSPDHSAYLQPYERLYENFISRSKKRTDNYNFKPYGPWYCVNEEEIHQSGYNLHTYIEVTLPDEILNAVYPFRVEIVP